MTHYAFDLARPPRTLTAAEQTALLRTSGQHVRGFRDHLMFSMALGTGLRCHELAALDVGDVFQPDGKQAGENLIEPILGGCVLRESWQGRGGFAGTSLNAYDAAGKRWHQTWLDNQGGRLDLAGGLEGRAMVLASSEPHPDKPGVTLRQRISWSLQDDASVRQLWETSEDGGKTWSIAFDGRYVRKR